ncbi:hypothetical protein I6N90_15530 [Paenibacillus sp. GSMTC-2017]|uniref:hypothetical protein n=1 Tax=Paenibacillus sp. GSMTC-2017 TaxID=2794350 RepID=UPI0018D6371B|nr:hypothetical protein [Paenibacillus sp. GSMTC-2017]MBH5319214.1 hypothetical protein [Paenibacillus sp. GSMTC-2017]
MRECIFHFKVIRGNKTETLRALIMLDSNKTPTITDFIEAFEQLGYHVRLENEHELIFAPKGGKEDYKLDVTRIEIKGETDEQSQHDGELKALVEHLVRRN